jgi:hypothetical protein
MADQNRPEDFGTMDCKDGITITHPGVDYEVRADGRFYGAESTLWGAMQIVNEARATKLGAAK